MNAAAVPVRWAWAAGGVTLLLASWALASIHGGTAVVFRPPWDQLPPPEAWFWLGTVLLRLPGATLLGAAFAPSVERLFRALVAAGERLSTRERRLVGGAATLLVLALARLGNWWFFAGLPFTDDEYACQFGGQVWASGALGVPVPPYFPAAPSLFLFSHQGLLSSFDFPGAIAPWAVATFTGTGPLVFAVFAALGFGGVVTAAARRWGISGALVAAFLALVSPHFGIISMSTHTHVVSRGLFAAGLGVLLFVERPQAWRGVVGGLLLGCAGLTRPPELVMLTAPWLLWMLVEAWRERRWRFLLALSGSLTACGALFVWLNLEVGGVWTPTRMAPNDVMHPYVQTLRGAFEPAAWVDRFGNNVTYNFLSSAMFLLGPLGMLLVFAGAWGDRTHRLLALGAAGAYLLGLLHDDRGLHALGPVHVSEASVTLVLLALCGLNRLWTWAERFELRTRLLGAGAGYFAGLVLFTAGYAAAYQRHAQVQEAVYAELEALGDQAPAVVLAPAYGTVHGALDKTGTGTWNFAWRRVSPGATEAVVILHDSPEARAQVTQWFPDRSAWVLQLDGKGLVPLSSAAPPVPFPGAWWPLRPKR